MASFSDLLADVIRPGHKRLARARPAGKPFCLGDELVQPMTKLGDFHLLALPAPGM